MVKHRSARRAANFDPVAQPTGGTWVGAIGSTTLGTTGAATTYSGSAISLSGASTNKLVIRGDVTLYLTAAAGSSAISVAGNASIEIGSGASLIIYTAGDVSLAGCHPVVVGRLGNPDWERAVAAGRTGGRG